MVNVFENHELKDSETFCPDDCETVKSLIKKTEQKINKIYSLRECIGSTSIPTKMIFLLDEIKKVQWYKI